MSAKAKEQTFSAALADVEDILSRLERDEISIDQLSGEVKRAVELVTFCRAKLQETETEVRDLVTGLDESGDDE